MEERFKCLQSTASTNLDLEEIGRKGGPRGFVIAANSQDKGRGRFNRDWFSPPDVNLYFSMLLLPSKESFEIPSITLVAAVTLHEVISRGLPSQKIEIKWPNDVLCSRKKIAGILSEYHQGKENNSFVVVGVGLNINLKSFPSGLEHTATSMDFRK